MRFSKGRNRVNLTLEATDGQLVGKHGQRLLANKVDTSNPNELWFGNDIMVMANPHMAGLPMWVIALLMAGCIVCCLVDCCGLALGLIHLDFARSNEEDPEA